MRKTLVVEWVKLKGEVIEVFAGGLWQKEGRGRAGNGT